MTGVSTLVVPAGSSAAATPDSALGNTAHVALSMTADTHYRSRPVAVAVDPVALVISECITVTSVMRKHARWAHSSVSSILGGNPNPIHLGPPSPLLRPGSRGSGTGFGADGSLDVGVANRWGLRGQKGKSMADNPLMAGFGRLRHDLQGCKGTGNTPSRLQYAVAVGNMLTTLISQTSTTSMHLPS